MSKLSVKGDSHDKNSINQQKTRKQHSPEFRSEALKLAERIGIAAAALLQIVGGDKLIIPFC
ncbi:hypothetical protein TUJ17_27645 [Escherichia coli]|uniref:hypothetical protein n=1 Tax=Escherichia coli TaxID=562 RepID=UPI002AAD010A|nr:hypothetical protein [Escherichia coli]MDY7495584.1 hypothetical protein [Escherichia coli]